MQTLNLVIQMWPILAVIGGVVIIMVRQYYTSKNTDADHEKRLQEHDKEIADLRKIADLERRVVVLESDGKSNATVLHNVELSVKGIETKMDILLSHKENK